MKLFKKSLKRGFTLIELMIVVAIIGILAAIAVPKFADLLTKSRESASKGTIGAVRAASAIYSGDTEGSIPGASGVAGLWNCLASNQKYMGMYAGVLSLGKMELPSHSRNAGHTTGLYLNMSADGAVGTAAGDTTPILYNTTTGNININCSHLDTKSSNWSTI